VVKALFLSMSLPQRLFSVLAGGLGCGHGGQANDVLNNITFLDTSNISFKADGFAAA
jgi:hypothetical protein